MCSGLHAAVHSKQTNLVEGAADAAVQDEGDQQLLHVRLRHVQLLGDVWYPDARVRLYELQHHLRRRKQDE